MCTQGLWLYHTQDATTPFNFNLLPLRVSLEGMVTIYMQTISSTLLLEIQTSHQWIYFQKEICFGHYNAASSTPIISD